ncbi:uncharacterized protein EV420DRAFT_1480943 [Desarmillaria tabescens]|uniref:Uncharacterized protein n=1 Tax=Armillaria tabescens TaxID=1929756 RepID=A0AA39N4L5_ARMTA|nr:uncharacterized protein EV420DRAFT_1480943 [Desarmillaria tabescens]KAK0457070.1 hypothetical protein EV420DRAFT_1480943 [Desarmillaria tabescens]
MAIPWKLGSTNALRHSWWFEVVTNVTPVACSSSTTMSTADSSSSPVECHSSPTVHLGMMARRGSAAREMDRMVGTGCFTGLEGERGLQGNAIHAPASTTIKQSPLYPTDKCCTSRVCSVDHQLLSRNGEHRPPSTSWTEFIRGCDLDGSETVSALADGESVEEGRLQAGPAEDKGSSDVIDNGAHAGETPKTNAGTADTESNGRRVVRERGRTVLDIKEVEVGIVQRWPPGCLISLVQSTIHGMESVWL